MVLNMLTTTSMVLLGKTYRNWMVDLRATNGKLKSRSLRIVSAITGLDLKQAADQLQRCDGEVKTAILAAIRSITPAHSRQLLQQSKGNLRDAMKAHRSEESSESEGMHDHA
jgi:N-acetylmuramic acid 6-phosphate etherase